MLSWAAFSQVFGRRPILLLTLLLFAVGAILCAISQSFPLMLVGRSIQGAGAGGLITLTQILLTDMVPLRDRSKYLALISTVWAIGSVSGPIVGGGLAQNGLWRWTFWMNLPIIAVGFVGIMLFLDLKHRPRSISAKLAEIDHIGSFIFVGSTTSFLIPITWGGVMFPWSSWQTLVPLLLGVFGPPTARIFETTAATVTILPLAILRNRTTSISYLCTFVHGVILWSMIYYLPLYFQGVLVYSPVHAGLAALPQSCTVVPCAIATGVIAAAVGKYRWAIWSGWILTAVGCGLLCLLHLGTTKIAWIFLLMLSGIGIGLLYPSLSIAIQASSPQKDVAVAATLFEFFRHLGQCVGVAIGGTIFQNRMQAELRAIPGLADRASQYSGDAASLVVMIRNLPPDAVETLQLKNAFASSFRVIWAVMCGLAGLALIGSLCVQGYGLNQLHITDQGFQDRGRTQEIESLPSPVTKDAIGRKEEADIEPKGTPTKLSAEGEIAL